MQRQIRQTGAWGIHLRANPRNRARGQSLPELAIVLPLMMLLLVMGIDFGRVFLGWVELNNVVREAADFAAQNPTAWSTVQGDPNARARYADLIASESRSINCTMPSPLPTPSFPDGPDNPNGLNTIGSPVTVGLTCNFSLITPIVGGIVGNPLRVSSSAAFPIRNGTIADIPVQAVIPTPTPTGSPTPTPIPTPTPTPNGTPTPTPTPVCTVPNLSNDKTQNVAADWANAGFTQPVVFSPLNPPSGTNVKSQSIARGTSAPCGGTSISVFW